MEHIKFFKDISKTDVAIAGGKGASLGEMTQAGIPVPPGFVVLSGAFDDYLSKTGLKEEIDARLKEAKMDDPNSVSKASAIIRDAIHDRELPKDLVDEIYKAFESLGAEFVAVRSSATAEDSEVASWAGELDTFLNTSHKSIIHQIKKCWSSLYSPRAIFYRHEKNLSDHYVSVAVVVQKMIQSYMSGVAFTVHPVTEDRNQMVIEAAYGLGEAVVSGQVTPDTYVVDKTNFKILDVSVSDQTRKLVKSKIKGKKDNEWVEIDDTEGFKPKLRGKRVVELAELCKKIEEHYKFPCDIEWAMEIKKLYIMQCRPITTLN